MFYQGVGRRKRNRIARDCFQRVGLLDWAEPLPPELSGGQTQPYALHDSGFVRGDRKTHGRGHERQKDYLGRTPYGVIGSRAGPPRMSMMRCRGGVPGAQGAPGSGTFITGIAEAFQLTSW